MVLTILLLMVIVIIASLIALGLTGGFYLGLIAALIFLFIFIIKVFSSKNKKEAFKNNCIYLILMVIAFCISFGCSMIMDYMKDYSNNEYTSDSYINNIYKYKYVNGNQSIEIDKDTGIMTINIDSSTTTMTDTKCYSIGSREFTCKGNVEGTGELAFIFSFDNGDLIYEKTDSVLMINGMTENTRFQRISK